MNIQLTSRHIDLGDALKTHVRDHLEKSIHKYFDHVVDTQVTVTKTTYGIETHVEVHLGRNIVVRSEDVASDPYASVDLVMKKLEKNLQRYKSRLKAHHSNHDVSKEEQAMQYVLDSSYRNLDHKEEDESCFQAPIVAETAAYIPSLTVSEAAMRMDLGGTGALMFRNKAHGQLNMVYLRKDGSIGWVDPEGNKKAHEHR